MGLNFTNNCKTYQKKIHYEKKKVSTTSLITQFLSCRRLRNSLYLYAMNANIQVTWIVEL